MFTQFNKTNLLAVLLTSLLFQSNVLAAGAENPKEQRAWYSDLLRWYSKLNEEVTQTEVDEDAENPGEAEEARLAEAAEARLAEEAEARQAEEAEEAAIKIQKFFKGNIARKIQLAEEARLAPSPEGRNKEIQKAIIEQEAALAKLNQEPSRLDLAKTAMKKADKCIRLINDFKNSDLKEKYENALKTAGRIHQLTLNRQKLINLPKTEELLAKANAENAALRSELKQQAAEKESMENLAKTAAENMNTQIKIAGATGIVATVVAGALYYGRQAFLNRKKSKKASGQPKAN